MFRISLGIWLVISIKKIFNFTAFFMVFFSRIYLSINWEFNNGFFLTELTLISALRALLNTRIGSPNNSFLRKIFVTYICHDFIHFEVVNEPVILYAPFFIWLAVSLSFDCLSLSLVHQSYTENYSCTFLSCFTFPRNRIWGKEPFVKLAFGKMTFDETTFGKGSKISEKL